MPVISIGGTLRFKSQLVEEGGGGGAWDLGILQQNC